MLFWIICIALTAIVGWIVITPLLRDVQNNSKAPDVAFYRAQLKELDRDVARNVIDPAEADRSRVEIARRLLAADKMDQDTAPSASAPVLAATVFAAVGACGLLLYAYLGAPSYGDLPLKARLDTSQQMRDNRPSQAAMAAATPAPQLSDVPQDYLAQVNRLRSIVPTRPDDLQGWELLAASEAQLRQFSAAANAQENVIRIKADQATLADKGLFLDYLVAAADGLVSQQAEDIARDILAVDRDDITARYYIGALFNQTDRADVALRMWRPIVANGDPSVFYVAAARAQIEDAARRAGITYSLPAPRGPSVEDIENAQDLSQDDRTQMITSMVAGLADRLATQGGDAGEWAQLITAYGVLGQTAAATEVWLEAREVFAASDDAMATLRAAANDAGVIE